MPRSFSLATVRFSGGGCAAAAALLLLLALLLKRRALLLGLGFGRGLGGGLFFEASRERAEVKRVVHVGRCARRAVVRVCRAAAAEFDGERVSVTLGELRGAALGADRDVAGAPATAEREARGRGLGAGVARVVPARLRARLVVFDRGVPSAPDGELGGGVPVVGERHALLEVEERGQRLQAARRRRVSTPAPRRQRTLIRVSFEENSYLEESLEFPESLDLATVSRVFRNALETRST